MKMNEKTAMNKINKNIDLLIENTFDRIARLCEFGNLKVDLRSHPLPLRRQAIWYAMNKGLTGKYYTSSEISRQSGKSRTAVFCGIERFEALLSTKDKEAEELYRKVINVVGK